MFDSVVAHGPSGRLGSGALISITLHAAALTAAIVLPATRSMKKPIDFIPPIVIFTPRTSHGGATQTTIRATPRAQRKRTTRTIVQPPLAPSPVAATPETMAAPDEPGDLTDDMGADGPPSGEPIGSARGIGMGEDIGNGSGSNEVGIYTTGMTPPELISGRDPEYTREALEARVEGTVIARCVLTIEGRAQQCRILKPLPFLSDPVLQSLQTRRYRPVTFEGKPVSVEYVFYFRFALPR